MASRLARITDWQGLAQKAGYRPAELAAECSISLRQLERYCRRAFDKSPEAWLGEMRISEAEMLLRKGLTIKDVSYRLAFKQVSHFSREFKRHTGKRASDWIA